MVGEKGVIKESLLVFEFPGGTPCPVVKTGKTIMAEEQYSSCFSLSDITDSLHLIHVLETESQWCSV